MSILSAKPSEAAPRFQRIVGRFSASRPGPTLICVGGLHGNEVSGVRAMERVFEALKHRQPPFRGEFLGLAGNLAALARGVRYIEEDLNRIWTEPRVRRIRATNPDLADNAEDAELRELLGELDLACSRTTGGVFFMDLHTSSAFGEPFVLLGDTLRNRAFALKFPVPVILGLEEQIDGTLLEHVNGRGHVTLGVEAGEHDDPSAVDNQAAAIWIGLAAAGNVPTRDVSEVAAAVQHLRRQARGLPRVLEILYRHGVTPHDGFVMNAGYRNFQSVKPREAIAKDNRGEIQSLRAGRILLPLYQGLGNDGFFIAREVRPFWLKLSAILRRLRADRLVGLLPGVHAHPDQPNAYVINRRIARWMALPVFHILGFRKLREFGRQLVVSRRPYDLCGPDS